MWVRFSRAFDFRPKARPQVTIAYKPGVYNVTRECAEKAKAAGAGRPVKATKSADE